LLIWELCHCYKGTNGGSTGMKKLEDFKRFLGIENKYPEFKDLNKKILKPAIKEINEKSDLYIKADFKKHLRKVTHIRFLALKNTSFTPEQPDKQEPLTQKQMEENKARFAELANMVEGKQTISSGWSKRVTQPGLFK